jgi:hypothetical protein
MMFESLDDFEQQDYACLINYVHKCFHEAKIILTQKNQSQHDLFFSLLHYTFLQWCGEKMKVIPPDQHLWQDRKELVQ